MILVFPNFLSKVECNRLNEIALQGVEEGWVGPGISRGSWGYSGRYTSRMYMKNQKYPQDVIDISNKIRKFMNIDHYPIIDGHGSDGVVVSVTFNGGDVHSHRDPRSSNGDICYRCNVMTQEPDEGGILYVDDQPVNINVGDLHCYYASEQTHYVTEVKGSTPRILWMFGAYRPPENFVKTP
jgi:hypothetical protein